MKKTNLYCVTIVTSLFFSMSSMEQQRGAKRVLFPASEASPEKGYGTDKDVASPGTPVAYKKTKASLGIHKVNFVNTTFQPVVLTYQASAGTAVAELAPFNQEDKQRVALKSEIGLSKPVYISTHKGFFRLQLNPEKTRIELFVPVTRSELEPNGYSKRQGIDYQSDKLLMIRIMEDLKLNVSNPIIELSY